MKKRKNPSITKPKHTKKQPKNQPNKPLEILVRYLILLALMFSLPLIYKIFTPLTILSTSNILSLFYNISVSNDIISINTITLVKIIPACVAGSAYLLLLILNLSVPLPLRKRTYSILLGFLIFFLVNILRIVILSSWYHHKIILFDFTHTLSWYFGSTLLILAVWFLTVKLFSIKEIPIYTDITYLIRNSRR
jgi:exosortase/archaeosortase family protein|tara:strand:- start:169 stop:747 length:579 start_codon:yes stop_codon:yes gene_type:complete